MSARPVLGDVFAPVDALTVQARLGLSALLAVPGRAPAIFPQQLALLPLPADRDGRRAVRDVIVNGLDAPALAVLSGYRLDAVVPLLAGHDDDVVFGFVPSPVLVALARHRNGTLITELTVDRIAGWPGLGPRRVALLVGAAVDAGLVLAGSGEATPAVVGPDLDDLGTVLTFDAETDGELRRRLAGIAEAGPSEVSAAAARLLAVPASDPERCLAFLDGALAAAGDERDRCVFEHRMLALGPSVTAVELSAVIGVGAERVRQLGGRAAARVDAAVDEAPPAVRRVSANVAEHLGAAAPVAAADAILAALGLPALADSRSRLLLRLAGPYRAVAGHSGWIALDPAELIAETRSMIHEDGGVRLAEHLVKELLSLRMSADHVDAWLARQPVRIGEGLVVATTGAPSQVAERALHACGRPLSPPEMARWVPIGREGIATLWSHPDRRFVVTEGGALALAEWGDVRDEAGPSSGRPTLTYDADVVAAGS